MHFKTLHLSLLVASLNARPTPTEGKTYGTIEVYTIGDNYPSTPKKDISWAKKCGTLGAITCLLALAGTVLPDHLQLQSGENALRGLNTVKSSRCMAA
jgi:hypothetical protein